MNSKNLVKFFCCSVFVSLVWLFVHRVSKLTLSQLGRKENSGWSSCAKFQRGRSHRDISQIGIKPTRTSLFIHRLTTLYSMKKKRMLDHTPLPRKKGKTLNHNCSGGHSSPHVFQTHRMINSSILFPMRFYFFHEREYCTNVRETPFNFCPVAKNCRSIA